MRERTVFTTHTPVPAGNETYSPEEFLECLRRPRRPARDRRRGVPRPLPRRSRTTRRAARDDAARDPDEPPPQRRQPAPRRGRARDVAADVPGLRARRRADHARHERRAPPDVRRRPDARAARPPARQRLARARSAIPRSGRRCATIPNEELWAARCEARAELVGFVRERQPGRAAAARRADRLRARGRDRPRASMRSRSASPAGFATYKRAPPAHARPDRALRILTGAAPVQLLVAGKAHPNDEAGKEIAPAALQLQARRRDDRASGSCSSRTTTSTSRAHLVSGCDVWINLPRRPMEASGTSGMKATFNGGAPAQRARRLVGRGLRRRERLGDPGDETATRTSSTPATPSGSTTCSSTR